MSRNDCGVLKGWHAIHPLSLISRSENDHIMAKNAGAKDHRLCANAGQPFFCHQIFLPFPASRPRDLMPDEFDGVCASMKFPVSDFEQVRP
jgi:hypothetical protein